MILKLRKFVEKLLLIERFKLFHRNLEYIIHITSSLRMFSNEIKSTNKQILQPFGISEITKKDNSYLCKKKKETILPIDLCSNTQSFAKL